MTKSWIPDGNGGFIENIAAGGLESIGIFILTVGSLLIAPFMCGMLGTTIITAFFETILNTSLSVIANTVLHVLIALLYFGVCGGIYLFFFPKMSCLGRIGWAILALSVVSSPIFMLLGFFG